MHVGGTLEAPVLTGLAELSNAAFAVAATGARYTNALARLTFEGERLFVDRFEVTDDGKDRLVAIGELGLARRSVETSRRRPWMSGLSAACRATRASSSGVAGPT